MPANGGVFDADSAPDTRRSGTAAVTVSPVSVVTVQVPLASSKVAPRDRVSNVMSRSRSNRSATCSR